MNGSHGLLQLLNVTHNNSGEYTCQIFNGRYTVPLNVFLISIDLLGYGIQSVQKFYCDTAPLNVFQISIDFTRMRIQSVQKFSCDTVPLNVFRIIVDFTRIRIKFAIKELPAHFYSLFG